MPRKPMPKPQDKPPERSVALPENPYRTSEAGWTEAVFAGVTDRLAASLLEVQARLAGAWDEAGRLGYDLGFQAGGREAEAELRAFYEQALSEQEAAAVRSLQEQSRRLETEHEAALTSLREANRREIERLAGEHEVRLEARAEQIRLETEQALQHRFASELAQVEARVRQDTEQALRAAYADRPLGEAERVREAHAEGYTQGLNESARRYEEVMSRATLERREAVEQAYRKGFEEATRQADKELKASYQEGHRHGLQEAGREFAQSAGTVPPPLLDEARRQAYENGYEDGRSVGLARGRRQAEAEQSSRLHEATRTAYREGFLDGKRTVADAERSWAFGVLHLPPDAGSLEVKQHYKRLSMALHPDQNPQLADVFIKNLNRAKELLDA